MTIAFKDDLSTLDPAIGYDFQDWAVIRSIFSGLMDYVPGTTTLRPMLAERYSLSVDGLTYRFALRPGVVFTNGRPLVASDIVYSLTRTLDPRTASPGSAFLAAIDGVDAFVHGRSRTVAGLSAPDAATVVIRLSHPSAAFLQALALNFAFAVPREEVERPGNDFGRHPVGTGPFMLAEWKPGEAVTLARNPHYFEPGIPHLDRVTVRVGEEPLTAVLQIEGGTVDALGNDIPPARFNQILHDPAWNGLVARAPKLETVYLAMKTNQKPFDDLRVRRAVAGAIDEARLAKLLNGRYVVADQVLPVGMPGYDAGYAGAAYDPAGARALLAQAGYPDGFSTVLYSNNTDPNPRLAQAIQQDLAAVGIHAELRALALQTFNAAAGSPNDAPLVWSGVEGWSADYPDPSDFFTPILSCGSAKPGGWNWSFHCDPKLDAAAEAADAIYQPARDAERLAAWRAVFAGVMAEQPWVPVLDARFNTLHSRRLGGPEALMVDPIYTPINYAHVWVTDGK